MHHRQSSRIAAKNQRSTKQKNLRVVKMLGGINDVANSHGVLVDCRHTDAKAPLQQAQQKPDDGLHRKRDGGTHGSRGRLLVRIGKVTAGEAPVAVDGLQRAF